MACMWTICSHAQQRALQPKHGLQQALPACMLMRTAWACSMAAHYAMPICKHRNFSLPASGLHAPSSTSVQRPSAVDSGQQHVPMQQHGRLQPLSLKEGEIHVFWTFQPQVPWHQVTGLYESMLSQQELAHVDAATSTAATTSTTSTTAPNASASRPAAAGAGGAAVPAGACAQPPLEAAADVAVASTQAGASPAAASAACSATAAAAPTTTVAAEAAASTSLRRQRLLARVLVRTVLARALGDGTTPLALRFGRNQHGKPFLLPVQQEAGEQHRADTTACHHSSSSSRSSHTSTSAVLVATVSSSNSSSHRQDSCDRSDASITAQTVERETTLDACPGGNHATATTTTTSRSTSIALSAHNTGSTWPSSSSNRSSSSGGSGYGSSSVSLSAATTSATSTNTLHFNLTHTEGLVGCAVVRGPSPHHHRHSNSGQQQHEAPQPPLRQLSVGLDVEVEGRVPRAGVMALARRRFSPAEVAALQGVQDERQRAIMFCRLWSLKEAFVKARGTGISAPPGLKGFAIGLHPDDSPCMAAAMAALTHLPTQSSTINNVSDDADCSAAPGPLRITLDLASDCEQPASEQLRYHFILFKPSSAHIAALCIQEPTHWLPSPLAPYVDDGGDASSSSRSQENCNDGNSLGTRSLLVRMWECVPLVHETSLGAVGGNSHGACVVGCSLP